MVFHQPRIVSLQQRKRGTLRGCSREARPAVGRNRGRNAAIGAGNGVATEVPWRSVLGPESRLPNVYWGAMSNASLRRMSYYTALPPEDQVLLNGEASYRYIRQGTALWSALHAGRLTTSRLKDALGLRDHSAARLVGGPQYPETGVLQAYAHLLQPPFVPTSPRGGAADTGSSYSEAEALELNETARLQYNDEMAAAAVTDVAAAVGSTYSGSEAGGGRRPGRAHGGRASVGDGGLRDPPPKLVNTRVQDADEEEGWSRADRRRVSELAALAVGGSGSVRMRLLWGSVQEASAVATLATLFPTSQLEEVGLLCLPDPRPWGVDRRELPLIGASPDALITHHVPITRADIRAARAELRIAAVAAAGGAAFSRPPPELQAAAQRVARSVLRVALVRHTTANAVTATTSTTTSTTLPAAASGTALPPGPPPTSAAAAGVEFRFRSPPLFARGSEEAVAWLSSKLLALREGEAGHAPGLAGTAAPPRQCNTGAEGGAGEGGTGAGARGGGEGGCECDAVVAVVQLREVVEVKNHCPFVYKGQRKARKRGVVLDYVVRDRGPIESVWPLWVPQLQAHMACCGADSALLLSRSPSRGVRVFRMLRDDAYLAAAFDLLRELQCSHVAARQPPGSDPWVGRAGYDDLLQRTLAIGRAAETVVATSATPQLPGTDASAFWVLK